MPTYVPKRQTLFGMASNFSVKTKTVDTGATLANWLRNPRHPIELQSDGMTKNLHV
jgi:hypothetical protein